MDASDYTVTISHDDVEHIIREELKEIIQSHKLEMLHIEQQGGAEINEDYLHSKRLIHAAAIALHYHSVPADWSKVQKIVDEHEV
jgi:hypothetical protein